MMGLFAASAIATVLAACEDDGSPGRAPTFPEAGSPDVRGPLLDAGMPVDAEAGVDASDGAVFATYLYAPNTATGKISAFVIDGATGALTPIAGSPFETSTRLWFLHARDGLAALFAPTEDGALHSFTIDPATGALTAAPGSPYPMAEINVYSGSTDPAGKFFFVNASEQANSVSVYRIDPTTRALSEIDASPFAGVSGSLATNTMHPSGAYLYVMAAQNDQVHVLSVDQATGAVAEINGSPYDTGPDGGNFTHNPQHAATDVAGKFLYVGNYAANDIVTFAIAADGGALTPDAAPAVAAPTGVCVVAAHPSGKFLYAGGGFTIRGYTIATNGALTAHTPFTLQNDDYCCGLAFSADGKYLFAGNGTGVSDAGSVLVFEIDPTTGALTPKPSLTQAAVEQEVGMITVTTLKKN